MTGRYAVAVHLTTPLGRQSGPQPEVVVDLIWAQATPGDRLDHIRVPATLSNDSLELLLILRAEASTEALIIAERLSMRATSSPLLRGWRIQDIDALVMVDIAL